jgi:flagellar biosynthesis/type III secretory pathway protein FliH
MLAEKVARWGEEDRRAAREEGWREGIEKGWQEGIEKGIEKGRGEAFHEAIIEVLTSQFDKLPEGLEQKISAVTDVDSLKRLVRRAGVVGSVEEFESELD